MKTQNFAKSIFLILLFFALITLVAILKILNAFFIPLTVSILLSFVFYPFCKKLHKLRIPWALCVTIVIVVALFALYFIGNLLANSLSTIVHTYPNTKSALHPFTRPSAKPSKFIMRKTHPFS